MRIPRIFTKQPLVSGAQVTLEESASRHLCQVLRYKSGHSLVLFNGQGGEYAAEIARADHRDCLVVVGEHYSEDRESPLEIHLGLGLSKGDRFDWALQKATELGVTSVTPLITERTELRLDSERMEKKHLHWQRLIESSCEQAQRTAVPELATASNFTNWLQPPRDGLRLILHPGAEAIAVNDLEFPGKVWLAIGPEGGFSDQECSQAKAVGFLTLTLGPRILRTETAPVAAISVLQWLWGDWRE